jgi:hypothetical protein
MMKTNVTHTGGLAAALLLLVGMVSPVWAQDKSEPEPAAGWTSTIETPNLVIITNVDVRVGTWLDQPTPPATSDAKASPEKATEPKTDGKPAAQQESKPSLAELFAGIAKLPRQSSNVVVITNVNVDVSSWLNPSSKPKQAEPSKDAKAEPSKGVKTESSRGAKAEGWIRKLW